MLMNSGLKKFPLFFIGIIYYSTCLAQISPPGLGEVNIAQWSAIGLKEKLNQKKTITSTTFFGLARISNPDNYNPFEKSSIYVVNQEVAHRFKKHWKYAGALSYRWQNRYLFNNSYQLDFPNARQEIRIYSRISYLAKFPKIDFSLTYRPEFRFFYNSDFTPYLETNQFRSRFRGKMVLQLNSIETQKIIVSTEILFSTSKAPNWNRFEYKESRFCLYYSIAPSNRKIILNIGYMNNLLEKHFVKDAHYLAIDIMFNNPFKK